MDLYFSNGVKKSEVIPDSKDQNHNQVQLAAKNIVSSYVKLYVNSNKGG